MDHNDIDLVIEQFRKTAEIAFRISFDAVEINASNGFLIDQFLRQSTNTRTDTYGGSIENRCRILLETIEAISRVIPPNRIGVRLSLGSNTEDLNDSEG